MKKLTILMTSIALLIATAYGGMVFGYLIGGPQFSARMAPGDIALTFAALQRLRSGKIDETIDILENYLDTLIVIHCSLEPWVEGWLGIFNSVNTRSPAKLMNRVSEYRQQYPSRLDPFGACQEIIDHRQSQ